MKNLKKKFRFRIHLKSKHLLVIMTLFCGSTIVATLASGITTVPFQEAAGTIVVPFEKSIEKIGSMVRSVRDSFKDKQDLLFENEELKARREGENRLAKIAIPHREPIQRTPLNWDDALNICGGDYAKARKKYPEIYLDFMKSNTKGA